jgi:hypothetical protein
VLVSSMMKPSALTKSSPHALGAECTAVGLRLLKPKRERAGKEESAIPDHLECDCGSKRYRHWVALGLTVPPSLIA